MEGMGSIWALATVFGPLVLLLVFGWAFLRRRKLTAQERVAQKEATERAYSEPEKIH